MRKKQFDGEEGRTLRESLSETNQALAAAYAGFNLVCDPDLVEFYLFEIKALQARHTYLLRQIKGMMGSTPLDRKAQSAGRTDFS
ncbi:MAG: DUF2508 family protein [Evtepia sp.]